MFNKNLPIAATIRGAYFCVVSCVAYVFNPSALAHSFISMSLIYSIVILTLTVSSPSQKIKDSEILQESNAANRFDANVVRQIQGLDDEKESRTPAQQKIDSQLIYAGKMYRGEQIAAGVPTLEVEVGLKSDGLVIVDITTIVNEKLLNTIKENGGEVLLVSATYQSVRARVPINQLEAIANLPQVRFIQPKQEYNLSQRLPRPKLLTASSEENKIFASRSSLTDQLFSDGFTNVRPLPNGTQSVGNIASEGDTIHRASTARGTFNVDGTGIKIGVLSNGVENLAASQTSGDLGTVTVLSGQTGTGDEGTAMLEIIHDLAPGAQLYFATADSSITQFAQNIRDLRTAGCDIIIDEAGYFSESAFQDGTPGATNTNGGVVTQAVNDVVAGGALYFSAAANYGNKNDSTSTTWEGDFVSGGTLAVVPGGGLVNDFDPSAAVAQSNIITLGGGTGIPINLSWSDPLGASSNDYDLFIINNAGTAVSVSSTNVQSGTQDPYEQVSSNNTTNRRIVIRQKTGAANRFLHLGLNGGRPTFNTQGETHGHAAASGGYGVAATPTFSSFKFSPLNSGPYPGAFSATNSVETFSSDGPRKIFFNGSGTAVTPGDFSSTGGTILQQPVFTAADGVSVTGAGAFVTPFFGTSAAAAHAAAIAALIKSANPAFTQAQIKTALTATAIDIETAGTDRDAGFGIVMPYPALQSLGITGKAFLELGSVTATENGGNGNGLIERVEKGTLNVALNNPGLLDATAITSTLSTSTPGVTIVSGSSNYSDIAATSGTGANNTPFIFSLAANSAVDVIINFTLTVNYTGGWNAPQVINFTVETGRKPITTVLDTTAPATDGISFMTAATGTQTNLVFPDDPISTCAAPQANPGTLSSTTPRFDSYTLTNISSSAVCATVTLTADKSAAGAIEVVAYSSSFNPAAVSTNYLGDAGFAAIVSPGYSGAFSVDVPASGTIVIVVVELKSPGNGFPTALGSTYTLKVAGLPTSLLPTAANVGVSGRVSAKGRGIGNARVTIVDNTGEVRTALTNPFGYFSFQNIEAGKTYVVQVSDKRHRFTPQVVTINEDLSGLDFEAQ